VNRARRWGNWVQRAGRVAQRGTTLLDRLPGPGRAAKIVRRITGCVRLYARVFELAPIKKV
jgi:hypothetical protein